LPEPSKLYPITIQPGIKRDGTTYETNYYNDGKWLRFQRGKPRKMGGYREITDNLAAPVRSSLVWSRQDLNAIYSFSTSGIEEVLVDVNGAGSSILNRTPTAFPEDDNIIWSVDTLYDAAAGSDKTLVLAHASYSMANIDDGTETAVYYGGANETTAFTAIPGLTVSGGLFATAPYMIYYGTDGRVTWSNANEPRNVTTGDAGTSRVTGAKVVKGLSTPSSSGPAGLLWSLDSVIQMDYVGGTGIFRFTTINRRSTVLAQNSIIEYDGAYYWVGIDRFMVYDGNVRELPNQMNVNFFFDNLNFAQRQKVWAMKIPRFGEIWWFFPYGSDTECSRAVIWNVREQCWYDSTLSRSSGYNSQVFRFPVMTDSELVDCTQFEVTITSGAFNIGETITGASSNTGIVKQTTGSGPVMLTVQPNGSSTWADLEAVTSGSGGTGDVSSTPVDVQITSVFTHENGRNATFLDEELAIESYFETPDVGWTSGIPAAAEASIGINTKALLSRLEPDFVLQGELELTVFGQDFSQSAIETGNSYTIEETSGKIDIRDQFRQMRLRFTSNELDGHYEMGRPLLSVDQGDNRS
jgi:hypothetical protein